MKGKLLLVALLLFLLLLPGAFADVMSPLVLLLLPGIVLAIPFINYFVNFAVVFATQKLFLGSFFSRIPLKEVLAAVVLVTVAGWVLDLAAGVFSGAFLLGPEFFWLFFLNYFLFLFAGEFLLLKRLKFGTRKESATIALALGLFANPGWLSIVSWVLLADIVLATTIFVVAAVLVAVLGFVFLAVHSLRRKSTPEEQAGNRKMIVGLVVLFVYAILCISIIFAFPLSFFSARDVITCSSSQPSKINIVSHNFGDTSRGVKIGDIVVTNVAGGVISSVDVDGDNRLFASHDDVFGTLDGDVSDVLPVGNTAIPMYTGGTPGDYIGGTITISYTNQYGSRQSATINCDGGEITVS